MLKMKITMFLFVVLAAYLVEVQSQASTAIEVGMSNGGPQDPNKLLVDTIRVIGECSKKFGCHKGHCWAGCFLMMVPGSWCYTTKSYSQSFDYVRCTNDSECNPCWKCAGACTHFP